MRNNNYCGIDIGCSNMKFYANISGRKVFNKTPTGDTLTQKVLISKIINFISNLEKCGYQFDGIGIAFPGNTMDSITVDRASLPCLKGFNVQMLEKYIECNFIRLLNNANAATLAGLTEFPDSKVLVGISNGTSIGMGVAINGELFTGANGLVGDIYGNMTIDSEGQLTKIGRLCSGSKVFKKMEENEEEHREILSEAAMYLGLVLVDAIHFYNPDVIYFTGGGYKLGYTGAAIDFAKSNAYPNFLKNLKFVKSNNRDFAGAIGALKFVSDIEKETS